jgi:hypothetical protein
MTTPDGMPPSVDLGMRQRIIVGFGVDHDASQVGVAFVQGLLDALGVPVRLAHAGAAREAAVQDEV